MAMPQPSKVLAEWALTAPWAPSLEGWWTDVRVAGRALRRNPTFSLVTVLTLALGVGANAAIFTVVNAVLLRPLPYPAASRLVRLWETRPPTGDRPDARPQRSQRITVAEIVTLRPVLTTLTHLSFTAGPSLMTLTGAGQATRMQGMGVSPGYFETLGVSAHLGRTSGAAEEAPGADAVLILSYGTWHTYFSGRRDIIGQTVTMAETLAPNPAATMRQDLVIGVMPEGFDAANTPMQFWIPVSWTPKTSGALVARLADGATPAAAQAELAGALRGLRGTGEQTRYELESALDGAVDPISRRSSCCSERHCSCCDRVRQRHEPRAGADERTASRDCRASGARRGAWPTGATARHRKRPAGCSVRRRRPAGRVRRAARAPHAGHDHGAARSRHATRLPQVQRGVPRRIWVLPLSRLCPSSPARSSAFCRRSHMHDHNGRSTRCALRRPPAWRGSTFFAAGGARAVLVLIEVALAMVLLVGGGLMLHSFARLSRVNPGFDPGGVVTFQIALPPDKYPSVASEGLRG